LPSNGQKSHISDINQIWFNKKKVCLSSEDFVIGLATFNGRNVRNDNGFHNVTVLMTSNDLTMCIKYQSYVNHDGLRQKVISKKNVPLVGGLCHITDFDQYGLKNMPLVGGLYHVTDFDQLKGPKVRPSSEDFVTSRTSTKYGPKMCPSSEDFVTSRTSTRYGPKCAPHRRTLSRHGLRPSMVQKCAPRWRTLPRPGLLIRCYPTCAAVQDK
jgi:hypothetical protein